MPDDKRILLSPVGLLTWNNAFQKSNFPDKDDDEQKYGVSMLVKKNAPGLLEMRKAAKICASERFGASLPPKFNTPFTPVAERFWEYGFDDSDFHLRFSSFTPPAVVGTIRTSEKKWKSIKSEDLYSGCLIRVSFHLKAYSVAGNNGVSCVLHSVQKLRDGDVINMGVRGEPNKEFIDIPAEYATTEAATDEYLTDEDISF